MNCSSDLIVLFIMNVTVNSRHSIFVCLNCISQCTISQFTYLHSHFFSHDQNFFHTPLLLINQVNVWWMNYCFSTDFLLDLLLCACWNMTCEQVLRAVVQKQNSEIQDDWKSRAWSILIIHSCLVSCMITKPGWKCATMSSRSFR